MRLTVIKSPFDNLVYLLNCTLERNQWEYCYLVSISIAFFISWVAVKQLELKDPPTWEALFIPIYGGYEVIFRQCLWARLDSNRRSSGFRLNSNMATMLPSDK